MTRKVNAMIHDFTLVYELHSGMGTQDDVLRRLAGSDCADATVGRGMAGWLSAARRATAILR